MDIESISSSAFGFHFCGPNASLNISTADKNIAIKTTHKIKGAEKSGIKFWPQICNAGFVCFFVKFGGSV
jgi:hypothetical protein